jgi:hypothetical protein
MKRIIVKRWDSWTDSCDGFREPLTFLRVTDISGVNYISTLECLANEYDNYIWLNEDEDHPTVRQYDNHNLELRLPDGTSYIVPKREEATKR